MENINPEVINSLREAGLAITLAIIAGVIVWRAVPLFFQYLQDRNNVDRVQAETAQDIVKSVVNALDASTEAINALRREIELNCAGMKAKLEAIDDRLQEH
ncbi:MAG: hypothetical protein L0Z53_27760 [Acidobacteriales bacterium]|nr:hypothetical protein [Terriglobales bacterium]